MYLAFEPLRMPAWYFIIIGDRLVRGVCVGRWKLKKFLCVGDSITFADLCLIPQCYNAERFELPLEEFPKALEIYQRCRKLPECLASEPANPERSSN